LPEPVNGFEVEQPWQVMKDGLEFQSIPKLRDALAKRGLIEICKDIAITFREDEFLRQNREVILNTVHTAANYLLEDELLNFNISDCESFSVYSVTVIFGNSDMRDIKVGNFSDAQILNSAYVAFD
jgi:hypothetical protein